MLCEGFAILLLSKLPCFVYFLNKVAAHNEVGFLKVRQANLANKAVFLLSEICIPNPPSDFLVANSSHLIRWSFFYHYSWSPYEIPLDLIDSLCNIFGQFTNLHNMRRNIWLMHALAREVLPAMLRNLVFHSAILFLILSIRNWKSLAVLFWWAIGKPRYFPLFIPRNKDNSFLSISGQFFEKISLDLLEFTTWPEARQKLLMVSLMVLQFSALALPSSTSEVIYTT